jgi:aminopeptidase-like protein
MAVPLDIHGIPSGTRVFDWKVPPEWNVRSAALRGPDGNKIVDFSNNNLHLVSYSMPVTGSFRLSELLPHLHSHESSSEWIPYRTSYYNRDWGFCLSGKTREALPEGEYSVVIDTTLEDGELNYGELVVPGVVEEEVLVYSHICHPSLANDNLSGIAVTVYWAKFLGSGPKPYYTYRFVWGPGTIGSIAWLATNEAKLKKIRHCLVPVLLGRPGVLHYKRSRSEEAEINKVVESVLAELDDPPVIRSFDPYGYDERQFCSPGINLHAGRLSRLPNGEYPEYHSSADNIDLLSERCLDEALDVCVRIGQRLDRNRVYVNEYPNCEPQLGKRGLYGKTGGQAPKDFEIAMLWVLNLADGSNTLLDIAGRSGLSFAAIDAAALALHEHQLLKVIE